MDRDTIIRLAQEAKMFYQPQSGWIAELHHLERFAALVAAHEREECARICDATRDDEWTPGTNVECAAAIRSRA